MQPSAETTQECLELTVIQIQGGDVNCLLCGGRANVAHCWIPTDEVQHSLYTPHNRSRTVGYGMCDRCDLCLTDDQYDVIFQKLFDFVWKTNLFMPRAKLPSVFLN